MARKLQVCADDVLCVECVCHPSPASTGHMRAIHCAQSGRTSHNPKHDADESSLEARWVSMDDVKSMQLHGTETLAWLTYIVEKGCEMR
jgi:hypothetical protein